MFSTPYSILAHSVPEHAPILVKKDGLMRYLNISQLARHKFASNHGIIQSPASQLAKAINIAAKWSDTAKLASLIEEAGTMDMSEAFRYVLDGKVVQFWNGRSWWTPPTPNNANPECAYLGETNLFQDQVTDVKNKLPFSYRINTTSSFVPVYQVSPYTTWNMLEEQKGVALTLPPAPLDQETHLQALRELFPHKTIPATLTKKLISDYLTALGWFYFSGALNGYVVRFYIEGYQLVTGTTKDGKKTPSMWDQMRKALEWALGLEEGSTWRQVSKGKETYCFSVRMPADRISIFEMFYTATREGGTCKTIPHPVLSLSLANKLAFWRPVETRFTNVAEKRRAMPPRTAVYRSPAIDEIEEWTPENKRISFLCKSAVAAASLYYLAFTLQFHSVQMFAVNIGTLQEEYKLFLYQQEQSNEPKTAPNTDEEDVWEATRSFRILDNQLYKDFPVPEYDFTLTEDLIERDEEQEVDKTLNVDNIDNEFLLSYFIDVESPLLIGIGPSFVKFEPNYGLSVTPE